MNVIVCLSDGGGMMFNNRRQSRDAQVMKDIEKLVCDGVVFISEFSLSLFSESRVSVIAVSDPLSAAVPDDFVFLEDRGVGEHVLEIDKLIIYKWNRHYPTDFKFDIDPAAVGMKLSETVELVGKSHEKITREIWVQ